MTDWLDWPFFEDRHRKLAEQLAQWCDGNLGEPGAEMDEYCRSLVRKLGHAGFLKLCTQGDVRSLAIARATLARHCALADFAFAMQGLGSGAIRLFGTEEQKARWLPKVATGEAIAAFAMTEPEAGSDAANIITNAANCDGGWNLIGEKTYISNGGMNGWRRLARARRLHRSGQRAWSSHRRTDRGGCTPSARAAQI